MDDSLHELESELKALRPRRPSVLLRARVEHELSQPAPVAEPAPWRAELAASRRYTSATTLRSWKWLGWQMAAAAAVALTVSYGVWRWQGRQGPATPPPPAQELASKTPPATTPAVSAPLSPAGDRLLAATDANTYRPVKAANVLYDLKDEGPVILEDNTPARRVRARYVDTYTWKNPATNASLKWSVPRDEVRVVPARFH